MTALRAWAEAAGLPVAAAMVRLLRGPLAGGHTLLAVCPNSVAVTRAALQAGRWAGAPVLFAATLNQVDTDGGYTGWTPQAFAAFVKMEVDRLQVDLPVVLGLDHGGPWKKDRHVSEGFSYRQTWTAVQRSLEACLDAGYGLLHLDPTTDLRLPPGAFVPVSEMVARTVALMQHAEAYRHRKGAPPVAYEVGTDEDGDHPDSRGRSEAFLRQLDAALAAHRLPRPCFVVGNVGTRLDATDFDRAGARHLVEQAASFGALVKGHYTDDVADPAAYPDVGIGGANIGPGLAAVEYDALMELADRERRLGLDAGLPAALRQAVVESRRWEKWRRPDEADLPFTSLTPERQAWLIRTGCRYVWTQPPVVDARRRLYRHLASRCNAEAYVVWRLAEALLRYLHAFNLIGFNDRMREALLKEAKA